ncbi:MAG: hypothetical protein IKM61_02670 [Eubacteriaceae bacterium]|nr:hypothetical protein [Eubacteriaceae bacterium]
MKRLLLLDKHEYSLILRALNEMRKHRSRKNEPTAYIEDMILMLTDEREKTRGRRDER